MNELIYPTCPIVKGIATRNEDPHEKEYSRRQETEQQGMRKFPEEVNATRWLESTTRRQEDETGKRTDVKMQNMKGVP